MEEPIHPAAAGQPEPNETLSARSGEEAAAAAEESAAAAASEAAGAPGAEAASEDGARPAEGAPAAELFTPEQLLPAGEQKAGPEDAERARLKAVLEAIVYVLNEPMPASQIAQALGRPAEEVEPLLKELAEETSRPDRGIFIREVAGGYQMATKPEHHEVIRNFVRNLKQPLKLSQAALETLAVIAYKQPITMPEILEIRGVQGAGVIKTLIDRKLVTTAGRKNVVGRPILYKTTREFLTQFGLKDLSELPSLKEFEEIRRQSMADEEFEPAPEAAAAGQPETVQPEAAQAEAEQGEARAAEAPQAEAAAGEEPPAAGDRAGDAPEAAPPEDRDNG
jgi:segregation and condensation protein B